MPTPDVVFVMPTWNRPNSMMEAVDSLVDKAGVKRGVVVNNGDPFVYVSPLLENREIKVIQNQENFGSVLARNIGIDYAKLAWDPKYVLAVDDDIEAVQPIDRMVEIMERNEDVGIVAPAVGRCWDPSGYHEMSSPDFRQDLVAAVHYAMSCVWLMRLEMIDGIGDFDTRIGYYASEDDEYLIRARGAGWVVAIDRGTFFHHHYIDCRMKRNLDRERRVMSAKHGDNYLSKLTRCMPGCRCKTWERRT